MPKGRGERDGRSLVGVVFGMITSERYLGVRMEQRGTAFSTSYVRGESVWKRCSC